MQHPLVDNFDVKLVWQNLVHRPRRWVVPAVAITALALGYAVLRQPHWQASQALVIRDEVGSRATAPGRFDSVDEMQVAQETVLELAKSGSVIQAALEQMRQQDGQPAPQHWPSEEDVEAIRDSINVKAPNGAEFGRTEVFYIIAAGDSRAEAVKLNRALCDALELRLAELRDARAQSLIAELEETETLAKAELQQATARLAKLEADVGSDLTELRILNESASGESTLRQAITDIESQLRQENALALANRQLLALLLQAQGDPQRFVATPSRLLESQPALRRLKDGLIDAQLRTSQALGLMSHEHPHVIAAMAEEEDVRRGLHNELAVAAGGLEAELEMNRQRIASLSEQLAQTQARIGHIAGLRAEYNNLVAEVEQRTAARNKAQNDLANAKASQAAAHSSSLLTRLDAPQTGSGPAGISKSMIVLAGMFGGLLAGLGIVVLTAAPIVPVAPALAEANTVEHDEAASPARRPAVARPRRNLSLKEALLQIATGQPIATHA